MTTAQKATRPGQGAGAGVSARDRQGHSTGQDRHDLGAAALDLAAVGWQVFPLVPEGKRPLVGRGFHEATSEAETIRRWWQRWPRANIGAAIPPSLVVVDVDRHAGGFETLAASPPIPPTLTTDTGGGGCHYWFLHPGGDLRQGAGLLGSGVDTRTPGRGYVVAPPSIHASGRRYSWRDTSREPAPLPGWIVERLRPAPAPSRREYRSGDHPARLDGLCRVVATAPEGQRNASLNWAAYRARDTGDLDAAASALAEAARGAGLEEREIRATLRSGLGQEVTV